MKIIFIVLFYSVCLASFAQDIPNLEVVDSLYREDQFYFGTTYNILKNKPEGVSQNSFSAGLSVGFLRDFPINKNRTFAIAPGIGLSYANFKQNLIVSESDGTINYSLIPSDNEYDKNKFSFTSIDVPLEFRWRTSTFESHKFWRIYTGVKMSYVFYSRSRFKDNSNDFVIVNNPDINKFQYGVYIATGYNTWNIYAYYGLSDFFKKELISGSDGKLRTLNIGLMFYIL
ncbi:porin family protein [Flavobacterium sp. H122]|uniref:porin family protein n=1 Tax=Flavobacterium sp. H122 TaxID=2529860 RepID=UPI0010AABFF2|nr:porin family protein [Flavobacterium sp. H122]